jgi:hypothetical protein
MRQRTVREGSKDLEIFAKLLNAGEIYVQAISENSTIKQLRFIGHGQTYEIRMQYSDTFFRLLPDLEPESHWVIGTLYGKPIEQKFDNESEARNWMRELDVAGLEYVKRGGDKEADENEEILF